MRNEAIHRIIEEQAALRGDEPAIVAGTHAVSFRDMNGRANALARTLMSAGLRRCGHAVVTRAPGPDLAIALLAVLKAGAAYEWAPVDDATAGGSVSIRTGFGAAEQGVVSLTCGMPEFRTQPNLPVLTRGSDIACVLTTGETSALIPHSTVLALSRAPISPDVWKISDAGIGVWLMLMAGTAVPVSARYAAAA